MITGQIVKLIMDSDLIIVDLTGGNPNVYYEFAICHCYQKQCIPFITKDEKLPFDLKDNRIIEYTTQVDEAKQAIKDLKTF